MPILDACGGHVGPTPEFPEGIYHYHMTANEVPYSIDCYHGEVKVAARPGAPDLKSVAERLGLEEEALSEALGDGPPDIEADAERLGISADALREAAPTTRTVTQVLPEFHCFAWSGQGCAGRSDCAAHLHTTSPVFAATIAPSRAEL